MNDRLIRLRSKASSAAARLKSAKASLERSEADLQKARTSLLQWQQAQEILQSAAQATQNAVHSQVCEVVTDAIQTIYPEYGYTFHVEFDRKRGRTEARMFFRDGDNELDPTEAAGLGVVDVACFALRLAVLKLHTPAVAPVIVADEPMKFVAKNKKEAVASLMHQLAEQAGVQVIMATHDEEFMTDTVIDLGDR